MDSKQEDQQRRSAAIVQIFREMVDFAEAHILQNPARETTRLSDRGNCIDCQYAQMYLWARLMVTQGDDPSTFVVALSATRTIFELSLDIALLRKETTNESVARFSAFASTFRARVFGKWHNITANNNIAQTERMAKFYREMSVSGELAAVDAMRNRLWPGRKGRWPDHWSGIDTLTRVKSVGGFYPDTYAQVYAITSAFVHGNPLLLGPDQMGTVRSLFLLAYHASAALFATSTTDYLQSIPIFDADGKNVSDRFSAIALRMTELKPDK